MTLVYKDNALECTCEYNATFDWTTSNNCDSVFCDYVTSRFIGWRLDLRCRQGLTPFKIVQFQGEKRKKCIRMGITVVKSVIWRGKSSVFLFANCVLCLCRRLHPQMPLLGSYSLNGKQKKKKYIYIYINEPIMIMALLNHHIHVKDC